MSSHPRVPGPPDGQEKRAALSKLYSGLRRYIHAFSSVASLERLPRLHHTRPWSFRDAHGNYCEAMSLTLQRIYRGKKKRQANPLRTGLEKRPASVHSHSAFRPHFKTAPPISLQKAASGLRHFRRRVPPSPVPQSATVNCRTSGLRSFRALLAAPPRAGGFLGLSGGRGGGLGDPPDPAPGVGAWGNEETVWVKSKALLVWINWRSN